MSEPWPDLAGRVVSGRHVLPIRVYYEDTDFSGNVYHANYLRFCERGRSDCLRILGIHHNELHWHQTRGGMGFVVRRMACEFLKPARIDDLLEVETRFVEMAGARMELDQKVRRGGDSMSRRGLRSHWWTRKAGPAGCPGTWPRPWRSCRNRAA